MAQASSKAKAGTVHTNEGGEALLQKGLGWCRKQSDAPMFEFNIFYYQQRFAEGYYCYSRQPKAKPAKA